MKRYGLITDSSVFDTKKDNEKYNTLKNLNKIKERFEGIDYISTEDINYYQREINEITGYRFEIPKILMIAFTHKSVAKLKKGTLWDDYNLMEYLGDSVIKFFNCKRIIKNRQKYIKKKEKSFTDVERLKFIRMASENNLLFSFICIKSGLYRLILHYTNNNKTIN